MQCNRRRTRAAPHRHSDTGRGRARRPWPDWPRIYPSGFVRAPSEARDGLQARRVRAQSRILAAAKQPPPEGLHAAPVWARATVASPGPTSAHPARHPAPCA